MAEHLTQDVDPRLAQSVVDSTTGADGVTTLSNSHGVEVATVVSGEEANSKQHSTSSNGIVDGNIISVRLPLISLTIFPATAPNYTEPFLRATDI